MKLAAWALSVAAALFPILAAAQAGPAPQSAPAPALALPPAPARIVVEGHRPLPAVWKVSKDGHALWVLGLYGPLPARMPWNDTQVERLVRESQAVLEPPDVYFDVGIVRGPGWFVWPSAMFRNPDGARLKRILPADVAARWRVQKDKYMPGNDEVETRRPLQAADRIWWAALSRNGFKLRGADASDRVRWFAWHYKVPLVDTALVIEPANVQRMVDEFEPLQLDDVACLVLTLQDLEAGIDAVYERALAWARGDMAALDVHAYGRREHACDDPLLDNSVIRKLPEMAGARERSRAQWLRMADEALAANASTLAMVKLNELLGAQGYLEALRARGYDVEEPAAQDWQLAPGR